MNTTVGTYLAYLLISISITVWVGHTLHVIMNIGVDPELTLVKAHAIAEEVRHRLFHSINGLSEAIIHTDPHSHGEEATDYHQKVAHHMQEAQRPIVRR